VSARRGVDAAAAAAGGGGRGGESVGVAIRWRDGCGTFVVKVMGWWGWGVTLRVFVGREIGVVIVATFLGNGCRSGGEREGRAGMSAGHDR